MLGRVDKRDSQEAASVIQAGICYADQLAHENGYHARANVGLSGL